MAKLADLKINDYIKVLIYGHSGVGKSCAASTFPGPIFYADFDGKVTSVARFQQNNKEQLDQIDFEDFRFSAGASTNSYAKFIAYLSRLEERATEPASFPFKTVVVDSLTTLSDALVDYILKKHPNVPRFIPTIPGQQDWGIILAELKNMVKRLLVLPCNVIFIGHVKDTKDEITGQVTYKVALAGQAADVLPILLEEVYRAYVETDKDGNFHYLAQTKADSKYKVRTQIPGMPPVIRLSYQSIRAAMEGKYATTSNNGKESK